MQDFCSVMEKMFVFLI